MARFFIDRPVFAWVLAIITMMAGVLAITSLPIEQYPKVAPPSVTISATYPGASAETVENSVTQVIEQSLTGIDNLRYFSASSSNSSMSITLTFEPGADPDIAQVQTQNKVQGALPLLPTQVQQQGVTVTKANSAFALAVGFYSEDDSMTQYDLSDLLVSQFRDPISRVNGVGNVRVFGAQRSMRIWLDPDKLYSYNLTPTDVQGAVQVQNTDVSAGQLGGMPAIENQQINATIQAQSRLQTVEDFENIVLRVNTDGSQVRVRDVARVELGAQSYDVIVRYDRKPASGMAISLASGANALDTIKAVKARVEELRSNLPDTVKVVYPVDSSPFIELSIESVVHTLIEAVVLVFLVMLLFLQNWRATLIPTIAVPVVLLGTFAVLLAFGFSINVLTMFAMVLAIGLLVDDAIVVVENVERVMEEDNLPPREATKKSMEQITSALVGIALVLSAVFVPMAFMAGSTGAIYRQFSLTIVSAMALSVLVALILTPALCATILKPAHKGELAHQKGFFGWFNRFFNKATNGYVGAVGGTVSRPIRMMLVYVAVLVVLAVLYMRLPTSFLPEEDQGVLITLVQLPETATMERTQEVMEKMQNHFRNDPGVEAIFTISGFSFAGMGQNMGLSFVKLKHWDERTTPDVSVQAIIGRAYGALSQIKEATIYTINPPPIPELGVASGFNLQLQDRNNQGHQALMQARGMMIGMAYSDEFKGVLSQVRPNGMPDAPIFRIDIDFEKVRSLGLNIADVNNTLSTAWGGTYVNDFVDRGRVKRVYVQADAPARMLPEDLEKWYVRNNQGEMVPFTAFASTHWDFGSPQLERYNGVPSVNIQGAAAPGASTGDAMAAMETIASRLPPGFGIEWTGLSYQERQSGSQAPILYAISLLVVFLCLAALYESWSVPFAVILVVPLGIMGALVAATGRGLSNDVYFQVGLLTTIGLSAKNAILIVEFAMALVQQGKGLVEATLEAARMRLRPIIMTSLAFILGVTPLALSTGAGAMSRQAIGTGVIGGMLAATFLAIFFVPLFYILVMKLTWMIRGKPANQSE